MKFSNFFPVLCFFIMAAVLAYTTDLASKANFIPNMVGKRVQQFQLEDLNTDSPFTTESLKGEPVILNMFASWCVSCREEHELVKAIASKGYKLYGLNVADGKQKAMQYLQQHGNPYKRIGYDPHREVAIGLGATGVPETYVISKDGIIYFHHRGVLTEEIVTQQLLPIMNELIQKDIQ